MEFKRDLRQIQITNDSLIYFHQRKRSFEEPLYRVVERILHEYTTKDIAGYAEKSDHLQRINEAYLDRIHALEKELREKEQTKLI